jgi:hypothetical protein
MDKSKELKEEFAKMFENIERKDSLFMRFKRLYWFRRISYGWYDFKHGIKNLIKWLPVIWKDRNWDSQYIYTILIKKLEFHRDVIQKNNRYVDVEDTVKEINHTIDLLKKINNEFENYSEPYMDAHDKKWGKNEFYFVEIKEGDHKGDYEMKSTRDDRLSPEDQEIERKEFLEVNKKAIEERQADLLEALTNMANKSDGWWD